MIKYLVTNQNVFYVAEPTKKLSLNTVFIFFLTDGVFEIVVTVAVQSVFRLEIHQDDVFLFFKNRF
jgi:hypothetical protein